MVLDLELVELVAEQDVLQFGLVFDVPMLLTAGEAVERRLGDVDVAGLDERLHLTEQEREREGADVGAVDVGVREQHDLVISGLLDVELVTDTGADRGDERLNRVVGQDLVDAALLDVEDLAPQGENRLGAPVARRYGRAAGGIALDDEQLGQRRVLDRAVGELAR